MYCQADISDKSKLELSVIKAEATIKADPDLEWIVNNIVLPEVEDQINAALLKGIDIPPLTFKGVTLATPVVALQSQTLLGFAALSTNGATQPPVPGSSWPQGQVFVLASPATIDVALAAVLAGTQKSGTAGTSIGPLSFSASYTIGVSDPDVGLKGGDQLSVGVDASGGGSVQAKLDLFWKPKVTLGLSITASPDVTAQVTIDGSNDVIIAFKTVNKFDVKIDIPGIPSWLEKFASHIISFLTSQLAKFIGIFLTGLSFKVFSISPISIEEDGVSLQIDLKNLAVSTFTDVGGVKTLSLGGTLDVEKG